LKLRQHDDWNFKSGDYLTAQMTTAED